MSGCQSCTSGVNAWRSEFFGNAAQRFAQVAENQGEKGHDRVSARFGHRALLAAQHAVNAGDDSYESSLPPVVGSGESQASRDQLMQNAAEFFTNVANHFMEIAQKQADKGHTRLAQNFAEFATRAALFAASLLEAPVESVPPAPQSEAAPAPVAEQPSTDVAPASASSITINIYGSGNFINITA